MRIFVDIILTGPNVPAEALPMLSRVGGFLHTFLGLFILCIILLAFSTLHSTAACLIGSLPSVKLFPNWLLPTFQQTIPV